MEENLGYRSDVELENKRYKGDGIRVNTEIELTVGENPRKSEGNTKFVKGFENNRGMGSEAQISLG